MLGRPLHLWRAFFFLFFPALTFSYSVFLILVYPPILKTGVDLLSRPSFFHFFFPLSHEYQFLNSRFVIRWKRLFNVSSGVRIWARLSPCVCVLGRCYRSGSVFASRSSFFVSLSITFINSSPCTLSRAAQGRFFLLVLPHHEVITNGVVHPISSESCGN